jgi:alkylhydroperoxidase family enzyme
MMARVSYVEADDPRAGETLRAMAARIAAAAGSDAPDDKIPNLLRALAHSPRLLDVQTQVGDALWNATEIDRRVQELVILRVAQVRRSDYEWGRHVGMARSVGVPDEKIAALEHWTEAAELTAAERAAVGLADVLAREGDAPQDAIDAVLEHFSERQLVELTQLTGAYVMFAIFLKGLRIDQEPDDPRLPASQS